MDDILVIPKKGSGCDYHRLLQPFKYLGIDTDAYYNETLSTLLSKVKVVVFNRWAGFDIIHLLRAKKKYGFKIVVDLDDYWELYNNHILSGHWKDSKMSEQIKEAILNADLVTVTTARLASVVQKFNKNIEILPNALAFGHDQFTDNIPDENSFKITYVAGSSHFWDLLSIKGLFKKITRSNIKNDVTMVLAGYNDSNAESKKLWDSMEKIYSDDGKLNFLRKETEPLNSYMTLLNGSSIAIAPLEFNYFNGFKSNLKILEAGCKNIPILVSDTPPYSDEPDTDGLFKCKTINDWYRTIDVLSKDTNYTREMGLKLGEYVREKYDLLMINEKRRQIFKYLIK